jgi:NAD(P)-dependent dehydrogenase (short-subunit alcohol dehydrogenase family)
MTEPQVWLITGAGRGLGVDIAKAALDSGHEVVATARRAEAITKALGEQDALLPVALDVTGSKRGHGSHRGNRRQVWTARRARQQCRQLQRGLLRGDDSRGLPQSDRDHVLRAG